MLMNTVYVQGTQCVGYTMCTINRIVLSVSGGNNSCKPRHYFAIINFATSNDNCGNHGVYFNIFQMTQSTEQLSAEMAHLDCIMQDLNAIKTDFEMT